MSRSWVCSINLFPFRFTRVYCCTSFRIYFAWALILFSIVWRIIFIFFTSFGWWCIWLFWISWSGIVFCWLRLIFWDWVWFIIRFLCWFLWFYFDFDGLLCFVIWSICCSICYFVFTYFVCVNIAGYY